jgi:hypothetical protein
VDGQLRNLETGSVDGNLQFNVTLDSSVIESEYTNSIVVNLTSEAEILHTPPVPLSALIGARLQFTGGDIDATVIRVGLLASQTISGYFSISGYNLADAVYVGFQREATGGWLNFSLSSTDGIFDFSIYPAGFIAGEYRVYAIAIGRGFPDVVRQFATLTIVQDMTIVYVAIPVVVLIAALYIFMRRRGGSTD